MFLCVAGGFDLQKWYSRKSKKAKEGETKKAQTDDFWIDVEDLKRRKCSSG